MQADNLALYIVMLVAAFRMCVKPADGFRPDSVVVVMVMVEMVAGQMVFVYKYSVFGAMPTTSISHSG